MPAYTIIGGDGKRYGPVGADDMRAWIADGRLNSQSLVQCEGSPEWKPLSALPDFADALAGQASLTPGAEPPQPADSADWSDAILRRTPELPLGECWRGGFSFLTSNPGLVFGSVFIVWLADLALALTPGAILYFVLGGVFAGGLYLTGLRRLRGEPASVGGVFDGFKSGFVQLMLAGALTSILTQIGFVCCLVAPGIYLAVAWIFAIPLVVDRRLEFWSAMELSRKVVTRVWFQVFLLLAVALLPLLLAQAFTTLKMGALLWGLFRDANYDFLRMAEMLGRRPTEVFTVSLTLGMLVQAVKFLNMLYAIGVILHAYESLFGARKP